MKARNTWDKEGRNLVSGDTMSNEAEGWIYEHTGTARFVSWEEAKNNSISISDRRRQQEESRARAQMEHERKQAELERQLAEIRVMLAGQPALVQMMRTWHDTLGWDCVAKDADGVCCLDTILGAAT